MAVGAVCPEDLETLGRGFAEWMRDVALGVEM
jgi:hypothetical protein